jgi:hypothetical protein
LKGKVTLAVAFFAIFNSIMNQIVKLLLTYTLILLLPHQVKSQITSNKNFSSDFKILVTSLRELHPLLYKNISKHNFDSLATKTSERLSSAKSKNQAIYFIQEFMYEIGNGHAGNVSVYNGDLGVEKVLPFSVYILEGQLYINDYYQDTTYNGAKINFIENTPAEKIIDSLKIFFPVDGKREVISYFLQPYFNTYYAAFCTQTDTFHITTDKGNLKMAASLKGSETFNLLVNKKNWKEYFRKNICEKEVNANYGYIKFDRFNDSKNEQLYYSLINELNEKKVQNLIIDLRCNNGGEDRMTGRMASYIASKPFRIYENIYTTNCKRPTYIGMMNNKFYLKHRFMKSRAQDSLRKVVRFDKSLHLIQPNKNRFKGHVYVLTGSISLSAATMFCKYVQEEPNVSFVGTETSGAINYLWAGEFCSLHLPGLETDYLFGIELLELKKNGVNELPTGLVPPTHIEYSISDLLTKKDKEMEWIINDILKKSAK